MLCKELEGPTALTPQETALHAFQGNTEQKRTTAQAERALTAQLECIRQLLDGTTATHATKDGTKTKLDKRHAKYAAKTDTQTKRNKTHANRAQQDIKTLLI